MSNGLHPTGCVYAGEDLQLADLSIHLVIVHGLNEVPEVRGVDTVIPGAPGRRPRNRVVDVQPIELAGWVQGSTSETTEAGRLEAYRDTVKFLRELFSPTRDPAQLAITLEDGTTAYRQARPLTIVWGDPPVPGVQEISVALEAVDEDWLYSVSS